VRHEEACDHLRFTSNSFFFLILLKLQSESSTHLFVASRWIEDNSTSQWEGSLSNLRSMIVPSDDKCDEKCRSFDYTGRCWGNAFHLDKGSSLQVFTHLLAMCLSV